MTHPQTASLPGLLPGLLAAPIIAAAAYFLAVISTSAALDPLALALLFGLLANSIFATPRPLREFPSQEKPSPRPASPLQSGAALLARIALPAGLLLYGAQIDLNALAPLGQNIQAARIILLGILTIIAFYIFIFWLNALWNLPAKTSQLIASGSAVCGAPAIAALTPAIEAEPEDTSIALLATTAVGLLGIITYPILKQMLSLSEPTYAALSGATLPQVELVRAAVTGMDAAIIDYALAIQSIRLILLPAIIIIASLLHNRLRTPQAILNAFKRIWFIAPLILLALLVSFAPGLKPILVFLRPLSSFLLALSLGSIALMVDLNSLVRVGIRPLLISLLGWIIVVSLFLFVSPLFL